MVLLYELEHKMEPMVKTINVIVSGLRTIHPNRESSVKIIAGTPKVNSATNKYVPTIVKNGEIARKRKLRISNRIDILNLMAFSILTGHFKYIHPIKE